MRRLLSFVLAALLLLATAPAARAQEDELTFLFTSDIHSNLVAHQAEIDGQGQRLGGFARLATAVRARYAEGSTLLVDSGDFTMGTLYQDYCESDALELCLMDRLGYDAVALGNHDFELTVDGLRKELDRYHAQGGRAAILCSNLVASSGESAAVDNATNPMADAGVLNYAVVERGGLRVGLFSLIGKQAVKYTPSEPYAFADQVATAKACVRYLRETERVDMVVLLSHCGIMPDGSFTEDADIAKAVDGIDVIVSGHMHTALREPIVENGTVIVCAGTALNYLGSLQMKRVDGQWTLAAHELIPLSDDVAEDEATAALIAPYTREIEAGYMARYGVDLPLDAVVATSPYDFSDTELFARCDNYSFGALMADSYLDTLHKLGYDDVWIAGVPTGTVRAGLYKGDMTLMDVYNVLSYGISPLDGSAGAPIVTACLTGSELYDVCETSISVGSLMDSAQILLSGMRYTYSPQRPILNHVYKVEVLNPATGEYEPVERNDDKLYKIAFSWTSAQSLGLISSSTYGLLNLRLLNEAGEPLDTDEKLKERIITYRTPSGETRELKEWYALYSYVSSFPANADGVPEVPAKYGEEAGYMVRTDADIATFFRNPSKTAWIMLAIVIVLLLLVALIVRQSVRRHRRKHPKQSA